MYCVTFVFTSRFLTFHSRIFGKILSHPGSLHYSHLVLGDIWLLFFSPFKRMRFQTVNKMTEKTKIKPMVPIKNGLSRLFWKVEGMLV